MQNANVNIHLYADMFFLMGGSLSEILVIGGTVLEVLAPVSP